MLAALRQLPAAARTAEQLTELLMLHADAVLSDTATALDLAELATVEADLRTAVERLLPVEWLAFFEYHAAWLAWSQGDGTAMAQAATRLEALQARAPDLQFEKVRRQLLLADLQRALGEFGRATKLLDAVDPELRAAPAGQEALRSNLLGLRSEILRETGRLDEAAAAMAEALACAFASGDASAIARALFREHAIALATGRYGASLASIEQRLATLPANDPNRATLLLFRGYAEAGQAGTDPEQLAQAAQTLAEARTLAGGHLRVRADLKRLDVALRAGDLDAATAAAADCETSLGSAATHTPPTRDGVEWIGLRTQLLLLRQANRTELAEWLPRQAAAEAELAREWRSQPALTGGIGFLQMGQRRDLLAAGIALRLALAAPEDATHGAAQALQVLLQLQLETSLARHRATPACTVAELQSILGPGHGVLVFLPGRLQSWVFLVDSASVHCESLPGNLASDSALQGMATAQARGPNLTAAARDFAIGELQRHGAAARERLLTATLAQRLLRLQALTIVGADLLGGVVLEALPLADGRLLAEALAIDHVGSLPLAVAAARAHRPKPHREARLLLLACTTPAFVFPVESLANGRAAYAEAMTSYDQQLTRRHWRELDLTQTTVLHVVAHGEPPSKDNPSPGVRFADGPLWREDIDRAMPALVIVSACSGGIGPARAGEGDSFGSMVGAFLWHGAGAVVASRRGLAALDHLRMMDLCHQHLAAGASIAAALRAARSSLAGTGDLLDRSHRAQVQVFGAGFLPPIQR
ncbi:MAG: CHAT domain-containing protein [Planctomycetes bacterium]|nr:CHAT domain-containing protein [Planctomycetota bacterium]